MAKVTKELSKALSKVPIKVLSKELTESLTKVLTKVPTKILTWAPPKDLIRVLIKVKDLTRVLIKVLAKDTVVHMILDAVASDMKGSQYQFQYRQFQLCRYQHQALDGFSWHNDD
ncbi:unnamed protein product [Haemonchus placei]|uniref:DZF domain-containing protein n=1 Tax=Haemonchus placei TaxID=6290 RepID=A0A0N4WCK5_HAEPC|nr:unnamed protein product [Haemonchus placei]